MKRIAPTPSFFRSLLLLSLLAGCAGAPPAPPPPEAQGGTDLPLEPARPPAPEPAAEDPSPGGPGKQQDSILVAGAEEPLPCMVLRLEGGALEIAVQRNHLTLLARDENPGAAWPDAVLARQLRVVLRCRILEEGPERVLLAFPWDQVEQLRRGPPARGERHGSLAGAVLARGRPLVGARLRAVRLSGRSLIPGLLEAPPAMEAALETVTGEGGRFLLDPVPPGSYKLWVQPRGEEAWLRRATLIPDIYVPPGERAELKEFDIRTVGGS